MAEAVLCEREGRVAILTINRPDKLNALNEAVRNESLAHLEEIQNDDSVGVVVITGAGEKSFVAGADIGEFEGRSPLDQRVAGGAQPGCQVGANAIGSNNGFIVAA